MVTREEDRVSLQSYADVELFEITLLDAAGVLRLKADNDVTWQGYTWEGTAIKASGFMKSSDGELARPRLALANLSDELNAYVRQGVLEGATVKRIKVLRPHLEDDLNISEYEIWLLSRVMSLTDTIVECELRRFYDTPNFLTPARMFTRPDFPLVSLS